MTKVLVAAGKLDVQTRRSWPRQVHPPLARGCAVFHRTGTPVSRHIQRLYVRAHTARMSARMHACEPMDTHDDTDPLQMDSVFVPPETHSTQDACPGEPLRSDLSAAALTASHPLHAGRMAAGCAKQEKGGGPRRCKAAYLSRECACVQRTLSGSLSTAPTPEPPRAWSSASRYALRWSPCRLRGCCAERQPPRA
jgi:hypothetical protein